MWNPVRISRRYIHYQNPEAPPQPSKTVAGKYKLLEMLGEGGMGIVYKAKDTRLDRTVALKFLPPELTHDKEARERFIQEAKAAAALNHPQICTIYEIDEADEQTFISMEYVRGQSLKDNLESGPLKIDEAKDIVIQVAEGLREAHEKGIIHRDIKPANIMLTEKGQAKITDFGLAKLSWGVDLTKTSMIMGTVAYMSPEQAKGEEVDHRTDIWSLGAMLYEMLTGKRPFKKKQDHALIYAILNEEPTPITSLRSDLPGHIEQTIKRALAKDVDQRYQNVRTFIQDLKKPAPITFPRAEKSIVVLPFENISPDPEQEYFCDGMTEEIISDLSKINSLRVISRTSAMMFKGTRKSIITVGRELDVQYVLEGSVRKAGNNLRITAQLIDAANDAHLWAEKYSGTLDDVFDIQEKVSRSIVNALKIKLTDKEDKQIANRPIEDVHAYECHLRAKYQIWRLTEEGLEKALKFIDTGLEIIGKNEILFADRGQVYIHYQDFVFGKDESYLKKAEECVKEIFLLNPESAYGNFLNGLITRKRGNPQVAIKEFKKAIQIYPEDSNFLVWLMWVYGHSGYIAAARPFLSKLFEIDPIAPSSHLITGCIDLFNGEFKTAIISLYKCYQLEIKNPFYRFWYAIALAYDQRIEEAIMEFEGIEKDTPNTVWFHQLSEFFINALQGKNVEALQSISDETKNMFRTDELYPLWMAESYALINEKEQAIYWLEYGIDWGFINYPFLNEIDPFLENIRGEPRFKKLMERVKNEWENFEV